MKKTSPLGFRESAGSAIRLIVAIAALLLTGFILYSTIVGLQQGKMYLGRRHGHGTTFYLGQNPKGFWVATVINLGVSALIGYLSIRDLKFTAQMRTKKKPNQSPEPTASGRGSP